jgi:hypothetical protein
MGGFHAQNTPESIFGFGEAVMREVGFNVVEVIPEWCEGAVVGLVEE